MHVVRRRPAHSPRLGTARRRVLRRVALLTGAALVLGSVTAAAGAAASTRSPAARVSLLPLPNSIAVVGDSISRGFNADSNTPLVDTPWWSWSTGVPGVTSSHYLRILRRNPKIRDRAYNDALAGTKMADLQGQLLAAAGQRVDYATVLMGANDVCAGPVEDMTPTPTFSRQFRNALGAFYQADPTARVLVASIPNVGQLWDDLRGNSSAAQLWTTYGICAPILSSNSSDATRTQALQRIAEYNNALAAVCALYARCKFDGYATYRYRFTAAEVSTVDYFHPSVSGQRSLAAITWAKSFWPTR